MPAKKPTPAKKAVSNAKKAVSSAKKKTPAKPAAVAAKAPTKKAPAKKAPTKKAPTKKAALVKKPAGPALQKIAFTLLPIDDATRARAFYEGVLGLTRGLASPEGTWTEYDLPGGGCLALFRHPDRSIVATPGSGSVAFEVADLDGLIAQLRDAGVTLRGTIVRGPNCRMQPIADTEGNGLLLHQLDPR